MRGRRHGHVGNFVKKRIENAAFGRYITAETENIPKGLKFTKLFYFKEIGSGRR